MPGPLYNTGLRYNGDGSLRPFTADELRDINFQTADVRDGSHPTYDLDSQGCSIRRSWFCNGNAINDAIAAMLGGAALYGTAPDYRMSRVMPNSFPEAGYEQYIALAIDGLTGARSAGVDSALQVPKYKSGRLPTRYEQVFIALKSDGLVPEYQRYVEPLPSTTETSYLTLPGSMMNFRNPTLTALTPSGVLIPYNVGRIETMRKVAFKWHRVPYEAWLPGSPLFLRIHGDTSKLTVNTAGKAAGHPYIGTVNSVGWLGYPSGTLLFEGVDEEIVPDPVRGFPAWNLIFRFLNKTNMGTQGGIPIGYGGHNYLLWQSVSGTTGYPGYYLAVRGSSWFPNGSIPDGVTLFSERNHLNLWKVGAVNDADI